MAEERIAVHVKMAPRLVERMDAAAREEGITRAEYVRAAVSAAALKSDQQAGRRARLEQAGRRARAGAAPAREVRITLVEPDGKRRRERDGDGVRDDPPAPST